ncbi:MAG: hypothetical protein OES79_10725 [Planctomycetota bacterium]|nr:hypothetical protein [Planctomycetota bacterium]
MPRHCLMVLILAAGGCGGEAYPLAPVAGTVTLDGAPVADARIGFEPVRQDDSPNAGPGSYGKTDPQGRYRLKALHGDEGAVVGPHVVWISTLEEKEHPDGRIEILVEERIPARYRGGATLQFTVPADGTDEADFKLTSN